MQYNGLEELGDISKGQCFLFWAQEKTDSLNSSAFLHQPLLFEAVIVAFCFFPRFRWRRRLLVISAPSDEDWAYSQQLSALSGQACNFGEQEAWSSRLQHSTLVLVSSKMGHSSLDHRNMPRSRLQIPRHLFDYIEYKVSFRLELLFSDWGLLFIFSIFSLLIFFIEVFEKTPLLSGICIIMCLLVLMFLNSCLKYKTQVSSCSSVILRYQYWVLLYTLNVSCKTGMALRINILGEAHYNILPFH